MLHLCGSSENETSSVLNQLQLSVLFRQTCKNTVVVIKAIKDKHMDEFFKKNVFWDICFMLVNSVLTGPVAHMAAFTLCASLCVLLMRLNVLCLSEGAVGSPVITSKDRC